MPRYIDADELMNGLNRKKAGPHDRKYTEGFNDALMRFRSMVHSAPTISPDEVRGAGKWIKRFDGPYGHGRTYCSSCGKHSGIGGIKQTPPYCPNCGAKMEAE